LKNDQKIVIGVKNNMRTEKVAFILDEIWCYIALLVSYDGPNFVNTLLNIGAHVVSATPAHA
jgi:hypothetical protein